VTIIFTRKLYEIFNYLKHTHVTSYSYQFTGQSLPHVNLEDDLKELKSFFPTKEILVIALDYLHHDREVKELVEYIQSEEFPMIHSIIEHLKEYTESKVPVRLFLIQRGVNIHLL
jgi:hypothetical protein